MGIFSSIGSALGFGGADKSASEAAEQQRIFNEKAQAELRRQLGVTTENLDPFLQAGQGQLEALQQGTTAGGLDERLRELFNTDIFGGLVDERTRAVEGQLSAGGLTRSGTALQEAARIPTGLALDLERQLFGRSQNLVNLGQQTGVQLGQFGANAAGGIANLFGGSGQAIAGGIIGDAQAKQRRDQQLLATLTGGLKGGIGVGREFGLFNESLPAGAQGPTQLNTVGKVLSGFGFFSDPSLKENVEELGEMFDLKVYKWDWVKAAKGTIIESCMNVGFMADEVKGKYPHHVSKFCEFLVIDYPGLIRELKGTVQNG